MEVSGQFHAPDALPPGKDPRYHWIGGWVDPRGGLDAVAKRKSPTPFRGSNTGRPARILVTIPTELWRLLYFPKIHSNILPSTTRSFYGLFPSGAPTVFCYELREAEPLFGSQKSTRLVTKLPALCGTAGRFINVSTSFYPWPLFWAKLIQSVLSHFILVTFMLILVFHLHIVLQSDLSSRQVYE
jgi:hypothetical protein